MILKIYFVVLNKNKMTQKTQLYIVSILLAITAIAMLVIGIKANNPAPTLTAVGFFLIVWAVLVINKNRTNS